MSSQEFLFCLNDLTPQLLLQATSTAEVEVDIDQLSTKTLHSLERYANGILHAIKKKTGGAKAQTNPDNARESGLNGTEKPPANDVNGTDAPSTAAHSSASSSSEGKPVLYPHLASFGLPNMHHHRSLSSFERPHLYPGIDSSDMIASSLLLTSWKDLEESQAYHCFAWGTLGR